MAEACGWINVPKKHKWCEHYLCPGAHVTFKELPNYPADLNAMHEAEKVLTENKADMYGKDERCRFITHLGDIVGCWKAGQAHNSLFQQAHATAAQRCEAFLKTLGKWKESPPSPLPPSG